MAVQISNHAAERLQARGVTRDQVVRALRRTIGNPEPGQPGSVWIKGYAERARILKVCVRADDHSFVITAVWQDQGQQEAKPGEEGGVQ